MWSADFDNDDEVGFAASYEDDHEQYDTDSDIETLLYSQVYHVVEEVDDRPVNEAMHLECSIATKAASVFKKPLKAASMVKKPLKAAFDDEADSIYAVKVPAISAKVLTRKKQRKSKESKLSTPTANGGEVVITIKSRRRDTSDDRTRMRKTKRKFSTSSSSSDEQSVADISAMYTHLTEDVTCADVDEEEIRKKKHEKEKSNKGKMISEDDLQVACANAMSKFYTTLTDALPKKITCKKRNNASKWSILSSDRHCSKQTKGRFFMKCALCNDSGHLSESCPKARKQPSCRLCGDNHMMNVCENRLCAMCWEAWHPIRRCSRQLEVVGCRICKRHGHVSDQCPDHWRKFHSAIEPDQELVVNDGHQLKPFRESSCYNCGHRGHFGHECVGWRMDSHLIPFFPFVTNYYQTGRDEESKSERYRRDSGSKPVEKKLKTKVKASKNSKEGRAKKKLDNKARSKKEKIKKKKRAREVKEQRRSTKKK